MTEPPAEIHVRPKIIGARIKRTEDPRLLTGLGAFVDDRQLPRVLHVAFRRSDRSHARIRAIDCCAALELAAQQHIGACLLMQHGRALPRRLLGIDDDRQRLEIDRDQPDRVLGLMAARGYRARHRLADIANLAARERNDGRGEIARHARGREQRLDRPLQILGGKHREHAGRGKRGAAIDGANARV